MRGCFHLICVVSCWERLCQRVVWTNALTVGLSNESHSQHFKNLNHCSNSKYQISGTQAVLFTKKITKKYDFPSKSMKSCMTRRIKARIDGYILVNDLCMHLMRLCAYQVMHLSGVH